MIIFFPEVETAWCDPLHKVEVQTNGVCEVNG